MKHFRYSPLLRELDKFLTNFKSNSFEITHSSIYSSLSDEQKEILSSSFSALHRGAKRIQEYRNSFKTNNDFDQHSRIVLGKTYDSFHKKLAFINDNIHKINKTAIFQPNDYNDIKKSLTETNVFLQELMKDASSKKVDHRNIPQSHSNDQSIIIQKETRIMKGALINLREELSQEKEKNRIIRKELNEIKKNAEEKNAFAKSQNIKIPKENEHIYSDEIFKQLNSFVDEKLDKHSNAVSDVVNNAKNQFDAFHEATKKRYQDVFNSVALTKKELANESIRRKENINKFERDGNSVLEEMQKKEHQVREKMQSEANSVLEKIQKEATITIEKIKEASGFVGITESEKHFKEQEKICWKRRMIWAGLILTFIVAVAYSSFYFYSNPIGISENPEIYQKLGFRITLLAILISAATWCGRIYKTLYHQELINNHKVLCLRTMGVFFNAAENKDERDAIIIQASKAVFGNVPTGFIQDHSNDSDFNVFTVANQIGKHGNQMQ